MTWNPGKYEWPEIRSDVERLESGADLIKMWSCGNSKSIKNGDRVFLVRLGEDPKGIIGSGYSRTSVYSGPHWNRAEDKTTNYIDIEFDFLIDPDNNEIFGEDLLRKIDPDEAQKWFPQASGISIRSDIASSLESSWLEFLIDNRYTIRGFLNDDSSMQVGQYTEGRPIEIKMTRYERNPAARRECLEEKGYSCLICEFNFEQTYGHIGKEFIHVHHINPVAEKGREYEIDPKSDLIPVCPNCHAMIHSRRPALSPDEIRELIRSQKMPG